MKLGWWKAPALRTDEDQHLERKASWLQLFFDLVFVSVVAVMSHRLAHHPSWHGWGEFVLMFAPVWWVWVGMTIYNDRLEVDDVSNRMLHFGIMLPVVAMAFFAHDALGEKSEEFALAYALARTIIILAWLRGGHHNPEMRPLTTRYTIGYSASIALFVASVWVPAPWKFVMWGVGLLIDHGTPAWTSGIQSRMVSLSMSHLPERMGLFTIIVLGESVIGAANGLAEQKDFTIQAGAVAALGLSLAFSLWWIYFQQVGGHHQKCGKSGLARVWWGIGWVYLHLPLLLGLIGAGAGVLQIVMHAHTVPPGPVRWLLCGSVALVLLSVAAIGLTTDLQPWEVDRPILRWLFRLGGAAVSVCLVLLGEWIGPILMLAFLLAITVSQIGVGAYLHYREEAPAS
ncbi:low temperature requirement protein A [Myxococcota bacterium]